MKQKKTLVYKNTHILQAEQPSEGNQTTDESIQPNEQETASTNATSDEMENALGKENENDESNADNPMNDESNAKETNSPEMEIKGIVQGEADNNVVQSAGRINHLDDDNNKV